MSHALNTPVILLFFVFFLAGMGLLIQGIGRRTSFYRWALWTGLILLSVAIAMGWSDLVQDGVAQQEWLRGWIWPREESGAIDVGVRVDALSLSICSLTTLLSLILSLSPCPALFRSDRLFSAIALAGAGVSLSWISLTPWQSFLGISFAILGAFLFQGACWEGEGGLEEARVSIRFVWEKYWGLVLSLLGAAILAGSRGALVLGQVTLTGSLSDQWGALLLGVGLFVQLQSFPFLGWAIAESRTPLAARVVLGQVFPAWAAFSLFIRFEPQLRAVGVFPALGWVAMASSILSAVVGVFESGLRSALGAWVSAGLSLALTVLAFSGQQAGLAMLLGTSLGAAAFVWALESAPPEENGVKAQGKQEKREGIKKRTFWARAGAVAGMAVATGLVVFITAQGFLEWLSSLLEQPMEIVPGFLALLFFIGQGWRLVIGALKSKSAQGEKREGTWHSAISPWFVVFLSMAWLWNGLLFGGLFSGDSDRVLPGMFSRFFSAPPVSRGAGMGPAATIWLAAILLGGGGAYALRERWEAVLKRNAGLTRFISGGFGADRAAQAVSSFLVQAGGRIFRLVDVRMSREIFPRLTGACLSWAGSKAKRWDPLVSSWFSGGLRIGAEVPAKLLQLVQNGNVQWYLLFGLGVAAAMLVHFLRFSP